MSNNQNPNDISKIISGFFLLIFCHLVAAGLIYGLGYISGALFGYYWTLIIWIYGYMGLGLWQLLYAIPLGISLKRRGKHGMLKGLIIAAVLTFLVNGACYLSFGR